MTEETISRLEARIVGLIGDRNRAEAERDEQMRWHLAELKGRKEAEAEVSRLREALEQLAVAIEGALGDDGEDQPWSGFARAALSEEPR